jgi:16S rRNA (guanine527-N7)-methyltransferase
MQADRIAELLAPFLGTLPANDALYRNISTYIYILLRWNARINLTAIRDPEQIVARHFGESLFAARHLFPSSSSVPALSEAEGSSVPPVVQALDSCHLADLGSGAGFPGLPIKLWAPHIALTLIESNHKKATFLREVTRALTLTDVNILNVRAEQLFHQPPAQTTTDASQLSTQIFDVVTLRAVEHFEGVLTIAANLVAPAGRLVVLIGASQLNQVRSTLPSLDWDQPVPVPLSKSRIVLMGTRTEPLQTEVDVPRL